MSWPSCLSPSPLTPASSTFAGHQIILPRKSCSSMSLPSNYFTPLSCFIFLLTTSAIWHRRYLFFSFLHYKAASLGPLLCHSWPLLNPRDFDGAWPMLVQCTSVESINQLDNQSTNQFYRQFVQWLGSRTWRETRLTCQVELLLPMWPWECHSAPRTHLFNGENNSPVSSRCCDPEIN